MKKLFVFQGVCALFLMMIGGCSSDGVKASLVASVPSAITGEKILFDASDSVYDSISWYQDGVTISPCEGQDFCALTFSEPGEFLIAIKVKIDSTSSVAFPGLGSKKPTEALANLIMPVSDPDSPSGNTVSINRGDSATRSLKVRLDLKMRDNVGVSAFYVSEDAATPLATANAWQKLEKNPATHTTTYSLKALPLAPGSYTKTIFAWFKDSANNLSYPATDSILYIVDDVTQPYHAGMAVNGNEPSTSSRIVRISLQAEDDVGVTATYLSENLEPPLGNEADWSPIIPVNAYTGTRDFVLAAEAAPGTYPHTVYGWFKDAAGNVSDTAQDDIQLSITDVVPPQNPAISIEAGAASVTSLAVSITLSATDHGGVTGYYVSENNAAPTAIAPGWVQVTSTTSLTVNTSTTFSSVSTPGSHTKTLYVWFKDAVGNVSIAGSDTITLIISDVTAPTNPFVSINNNALIANGSTVTLNLSATDDLAVTSYFASESAAAPAASASGWTSLGPEASPTYSGTQPFDLSSGNGHKMIYAWFKDAAGHVSSNASATVIRNQFTVSFVDGNGATGLNKSTAQIAQNPEFAELNSKLYASWKESDGAFFQIRAVVYNGNDSSPSWSFVDGNAATGLNKNTAQTATVPSMAVLNSKLYLNWQEYNGTAEQIRFAVYNGNDGSPTWSFVDGNGVNGLNQDTSKDATNPQIYVVNNVLYFIWTESNGSNTLIRAATYNGDDGSPSRTLIGILNKNTGQNADNPQLIALNSKLYAAWHETNGTATQIRVRVHAGGASWNMVDGNGTTGLNKNTAKAASRVQLAVLNSKLYAAWIENDGIANQIRAAVYNGNDNAPSWSFVDGNGTSGRNKNTTQNAASPQLVVFHSKLYTIWQEFNGTADQIRIAAYNGNDNAPAWGFVDGNGTNGINKNTAQEGHNGLFLVFNSKLYAAWNENDGTKHQIRTVLLQ